ncbi:MAG: translation initiation factor eIF-2B [Halobacteriaceae archaeon]
MIDEIAEEIREMQTHSSSVVAVKAARALQDLTDRDFATVEEYLRALERNSKALRRANPSHASLQTTQREIVSKLRDGDFDSVTTAKNRTNELIDEIIETIETAKKHAASNAAELIHDDMTVLTHDFSTTVLEAFRQATDDTSFDVFVTEARPRYLGRKMARNVGELDNITPTLIVDNASGYYLSECDLILVGMDCIVNEKLYNRIGTYPLAATAQYEDVEFVVTGSNAKIVESGFRFENDFRSISEVIREPPEGFRVENPSYDATPLTLVDKIVTNQGIRDVTNE